MGSQKKTTKTSSAPWTAQQPYIKQAFEGANKAYKAGMTPNADMKAAWDMTRNNINDPNSGFGKAKSYWTGILDNGGYDKNVFENISSPIIADITSRFMGSGRTSGGLEGINLADTITKAYSPFAVQQANTAASNLPALESSGANALYNLGQQEYAYPWQNLQNFYGIVGANNWGQEGKTTEKTSGNTLGQIAGAGVGLLGSYLSGGMIPPTAGMGLFGGGGGLSYGASPISASAAAMPVGYTLPRI